MLEDIPELYNIELWLACDDDRREAIYTKVCEELDGFIVARHEKSDMERRTPPEEWTAELLKDYHAELNRILNRVGLFLKHKNTGINFKIIPAGSFQMGFSKEEETYFESEEFESSERSEEIIEAEELEILLENLEIMRPLHKVEIQPFLLSESPLTANEIEKFGIEINEDNDFYEGKENVFYIFSEELDDILNNTPFRLPSEAEWEYACRAGTKTLFYWGNLPPLSPTIMPNSFELLELGNHPEVCADYWHDSYDGAPTDGSSWLDNPKKERNVIRGGSARIYPWQSCGEWQLMLSALRMYIPEGGFDFDELIAVRLAMSLS